MKNLSAKLLEWSEKGLISKDQSDAIQKYEDSLPGRNWATLGIAGLGIFVLALGIISVIAAGWEDIPDSAKIFGYFVVLISAGAALYSKLETPGIVREVLLSFFVLFVLAGIGLIGQLYNLESDGYTGIFLWTALTYPIVNFSHSKLAVRAWVAGFIYAVGMYLFDHYKDEQGFFYFFAFLNFLFLVRLLPFFPASENLKKTAAFWSCIAVFVGECVMMNMFWATNPSSITLGSYFAYPSFAGMLVAGTLLTTKRPDRIPLALAFAILAISIYFRLSFPGEYPVTGAVLYILVWSALAWACVADGRKRLFDFVTFIIGLRFIVIYFEVFGSLAATGFGLIISGLFILACALGWQKIRRSAVKIFSTGGGASV